MLNSLVQIFSPIEVIETKLCVSFKWRYLCFVLFSIAKVYAYVGDALAKCLLKDGASKRSPYEGHFVPCRSCRNALNAGLLSFQCLMWWTHETAVILDERVIKTTFRFLLFHSRLCH